MTDHKPDQLLAWYANGTLSEQQRREVDAWLERDPDARLQLAEYEFIQSSVQEQGNEEPAFDTEAGLDRLMARIDAEEAANEPSRQASRSLLSNIRRWFQQHLQWELTPAFARVAMVSQLGVVLVLGALLLISPAEQAGFEVLSGGATTAITDGIDAHLRVQPDLSAADFQALLRRHQAEIVAGPSSLGVYRIRLPDAPQSNQRLAALKAEPGVIYLERLSRPGAP